mgnify:CR=1 FL=1
MITIYKSTTNGLEKLEQVVDGCWIDVVDPTTDEIQQLTALNIPQDFVTYPLDIDERARIEREDDGKILIVLRIPYFQGIKVDIPFVTIPLGVVLTDNFILTVCRRESEVLQEFTSGRLRGFSTGKRNRFLLRIMLFAASQFLAYQRQINKAVEQLEDRFEKTKRNHEVMAMVKYQKSLVYFATALRANLLMVERLHRARMFEIYPEDEDLLEDVITETQQANEMVTITSNILAHTMENFGTIVSNNLNRVMRFLASITIVLSIPTIIASFYGMNVQLPLMENPFAYLIVLGIISAISLVVVFIFVKRDWF